VDIIRIEFSLGSIITDTTDRYGPIITVGGVGGDFSHTVSDVSDAVFRCIASRLENNAANTCRITTGMIKYRVERADRILPAN